MPRKRDVMEEQVYRDDSYDNESDSDEELKGVLKISAIFSGEEVGKLNNLPENCLASPPPQTEMFPAKDNPLTPSGVQHLQEDATEEDEDSDYLEDTLEDKFTDEH